MTADVRDQFGNLATEATQTLAVHETLPTISIAAIAGDNVVNESEASAGFAITGSETGADGRPVSVAIVDGNGHVVASYTTTASEGSWAVGVTSQQATALADGSYRVTADVTDQFGNASALATRTFTVTILRSFCQARPQRRDPSSFLRVLPAVRSPRWRSSLPTVMTWLTGSAVRLDSGRTFSLSATTIQAAPSTSRRCSDRRG